MNNKNIFLLFEVVKKNGNVKRLTHNGLSFYEIAELTNSLILEKYLIYVEGNIKLSEKGLSKYHEMQSHFREKDKSQWIKQEEKSKIAKIPKDFIYLPIQMDLHL